MISTDNHEMVMDVDSTTFMIEIRLNDRVIILRDIESHRLCTHSEYLNQVCIAFPFQMTSICRYDKPRRYEPSERVSNYQYPYILLKLYKRNVMPYIETCVRL